MDQYTLFLLLTPFGCAISISIAVYCWRRGSARAARPLAFTMSAVTAYLIFNTLELVDPTPEGTIFFAQLCYICIGTLTVGWLAFALVITNHESWLQSPYFRLLWIIPALTIPLVFTNDYHHLIWKEVTFLPVSKGFLQLRVISYGSWFWLFWLQAYLTILSAVILLIRSSFTPGKRMHMQSRLAVVAALLPIGVNMAYVLRLIPGFLKDYSPLAYAFSGILLAVSIFRYRLLDLMPFARAALIDNMTDAMLTLDTTRLVIDFNPAAVRIFTLAGPAAPKTSQPFPLLDPYLNLFETNSGSDLLQAEIVLPMEAGEAYYDLQIRRLRDQNIGEVVGYLVLLHAITEHKRLLQEVRKLAEEDTLTGVFNRGRFLELAGQEIEYCSSGSVLFSLLMIDIDYFKQTNDSLGHLSGDQLLQAFARRLQLLLRSTDLIGRMGGDEFLVLLPDTPLEKALQLADRLCKQIAAEPLETEDYGMLPVTISIGVAQYSPSNCATLEIIMAVADKGLYQAKALGRNQASVYNPVLDLPA